MGLSNGYYVLYEVGGETFYRPIVFMNVVRVNYESLALTNNIFMKESKNRIFNN
jgi:hypothetical protein